MSLLVPKSRAVVTLIRHGLWRDNDILQLITADYCWESRQDGLGSSVESPCQGCLWLVGVRGIQSDLSTFFDVRMIALRTKTWFNLDSPTFFSFTSIFTYPQPLKTINPQFVGQSSKMFRWLRSCDRWEIHCPQNPLKVLLHVASRLSFRSPREFSVKNVLQSKSVFNSLYSIHTAMRWRV